MEFPIDQTRRLRAAFGLFVCAAFAIPTMIVAVQWLTWKPSDPPLPTAPASIVPGLVFAFWGVWFATRHERLSVDPTARTLTWSEYILGRRSRSVTWAFSDVTAIKFHRVRGRNTSYREAFVTGSRGSRVVMGCVTGGGGLELRELARTLGVELQDD